MSLLFGELAWHYCKAVPTHHSVDCLPEWATKSLTRYGQTNPQDLNGSNSGTVKRMTHLE